MRKSLGFAILAVCLAAGAVRAATLAGVNVPDKADVGGQSLVLNGLALRTKFFVKVYVGVLYLPAKQNDAAQVLAADGARRMVMHFVRGVSSGQVCGAWNDGLEANTPHPLPEVKKNFATLCSWMEDIAEGKELVLSYSPKDGTTVEINGKAKGVLPGKPTSDAILSTWIGARPDPGEDFKRGVLGRS